MPSYQGALDGLCGPYAIANAFELCGYDDPEEIFKTACQAPASGRWPDLLWEGTTFRDLQKMISRCCKEIEDIHDVVVSYPFLRTPPKTNQDYWVMFDNIFSDPDVVCAIIGLSKPWAHWIVASKDGSRVKFTDTEPNKSNVRKNQSSLHAGYRRPNGDRQWLIDPTELAVFARP